MRNKPQTDCAAHLPCKRAKIIFSMLLMAFCNPIDAECKFDREDYEEPAGASFCFFFNSDVDIYGISMGDGTWLKNTPVFGDYALSIFSHGAENTWYSGASMTIRLMPQWTFAPFAGAGGSYNYSFKRREDNLLFYEPNYIDDRGDSYWAGHAEAGIRIWTKGKTRLLEVYARQVWTALKGDRDYWLIGISTGTDI